MVKHKHVTHFAYVLVLEDGGDVDAALELEGVYDVVVLPPPEVHLVVVGGQVRVHQAERGAVQQEAHANGRLEALYQLK